MSYTPRFTVLAVIAAAALSGPAHAGSPACQVGAYRGPAGDFVTIVEWPDPARAGEWKYNFRDGHFGSTKDGVVQCAEDAVVISQSGAPPRRWPRIPLRTTRASFKSGDVTLTAMLVEPLDAGKKPPLVVLGHGSERTAATRYSAYPYFFAAQGVAAFVFDKRGTGASGGAYTQSFSRLAEDIVAASAEAKRLAKGNYARFGLFGGSQGGWVVPRAANAAGAQFVTVAFGLVMSPLEEDSEQVVLELGALGYGADVIAKAREVTEAVDAVLASHFASGYERLAAVKKTYGAEPWFTKIKGEFTGDILASDEATLRREGRARYDNLDIDWHYDAIGELRKVKAPQLWILAGEDREAPSVLTLARLKMLQHEGRPIELAMFPRTDHGIVEFIEAPGGTRTKTRIADGYLRMLADQAKQERHPPYGQAITP